MSVSLDFIMLQRVIVTILMVYLAYAAFFALVPYALPKKISQKSKQQLRLSALEFSDTANDRVALVELPYDAFITRIHLLQKAELSIDIACHMVRAGQTTNIFFAEVLRAAERGVRVRIIFDGKVGGMSGGNSNIAYALATHPNIEYKAYNPLGILTPWKWNSLLHDKFLIIDETFLLLGGRNIGDIYYNPANHKGRVTFDREVLVFNTSYNTKISHFSVISKVKGYMDTLMAHRDSKPAFAVISATKRALGNSKAKELLSSLKTIEKEHPELYTHPSMADYYDNTVPTKGIAFVQNPINTTKKEPTCAYVVQQLALNAKKSIVMQTPYASANKKLINTFTTLGKKDISFEMLTNSVGSTPNLPAFSAYYTQRKKLINTGVTIYEFQQLAGIEQSSIHGKSYLFDDSLSVVGSLNLDNRSFYLSTETILVIDSPEFHQIMQKTINTWKESSLLVGKNNNYVENPLVPENIPSKTKMAILYLVSIISRLFRFMI